MMRPISKRGMPQGSRIGWSPQNRLKRSHGVAPTPLKSTFEACPAGNQPARVPTMQTSQTLTIASRTGRTWNSRCFCARTRLNSVTSTIVRPPMGQWVAALGHPCSNSASPISMITGPITTGVTTRRSLPTSPEKPTTISTTDPTRMDPEMYDIDSAPWETPSTGLAFANAMHAKNAARNENETPWMIGSREPIVTCIAVATPEQIITELIRIASCAPSISSGPLKSNGTDTVAPNIVRTCWSPRTSARLRGGRLSRG